ncbi:MAG: YqgE/AlgH family protein [Rhodospirillaceae bacterium]|jgi:putative transcriptional regulator|nr:YqgE/AlgH family protein [Rhodospirillaceae bacterium]MBT6204848.1 YqgE/AlgH family protein [Rhodospirillaceae bacterium]MBT6509556.1 YqgE/AlgH family protein [Rhodospirillaceae bacterium]MBT7647727.1 YqgE/AlgH family protein [Rhodospirillaceae bacterium]
MADDTYLEGRCLIAMPTIGDPRFDRTLIYMCAHSPDGAMGLVINKPLDDFSFTELLEQLGVEQGGAGEQIRLHFGGPVETGRGFVLHSDDYMHDGTLEIADGIALTATIDVLKAMACGSGPQSSLLALGYAGWAPGQLDAEIQANGWLTCEADRALLFDVELDNKWRKALTNMGIDPAMLSTDIGESGKPN